MSAGNEEARRRLRAELRGWGLDPVRFQDQDLDMLLQGGYHNCQDLEVATYEHLRSLGLAPARVDAIVAAQCEDAGGGSCWAWAGLDMATWERIWERYNC